MAQLEIYWSFRSPYSYLAIDRLVAIARDYDVTVDFRPVRPLALREPDFFERGREQFLPYLFKDVPREAERLGISFGLPNPDPIAMNMMTKEIAPEQPIMTKVMELSFAAIAQDKGLEFAQSVGRSIWGGAADWCDDDVLTKTLIDTGLDLEKLTTWVANNQTVIAEQLARNETAQLVHHWGVPLMVLDGEPFFGQDRLESLVWRLDRLGVRRS
ncbi:MAG: DsbA family protein [Marinicaulis sp.]|nr:DsbA family protein [Marinicaulis sp.]